jgi:hypothetical protein
MVVCGLCGRHGHNRRSCPKKGKSDMLGKASRVQLLSGSLGEASPEQDPETQCSIDSSSPSASTSPPQAPGFIMRHSAHQPTTRTDQQDPASAPALVPESVQEHSVSPPTITPSFMAKVISAISHLGTAPPLSPPINQPSPVPQCEGIKSDGSRCRNRPAHAHGTLCGPHRDKEHRTHESALKRHESTDFESCLEDLGDTPIREQPPTHSNIRGTRLKQSPFPSFGHGLPAALASSFPEWRDTVKAICRMHPEEDTFLPIWLEISLAGLAKTHMADLKPVIDEFPRPGGVAFIHDLLLPRMASLFATIPHHRSIAFLQA